MSSPVRLGTRGSALAQWQTGHVRDLLETAHPGLELQVAVLSTKGDRLLDQPLAAIGGKGLFTEELEDALRGGAIDLAVHSLKDLPTELPSALVVGAILQRADPADVLVCRGSFTLDTLPRGAVVGTSSTRRRAQLLAYRPDLTILDLRGNADTRLLKAADAAGPYDAIVIAHAALVRLGRMAAISQVLPDDIMLPAPGQGALAVECRDEEEALRLLAPLNDVNAQIETCAERAFLGGLGGGCSVPVAARAWFEAGRLILRGRVCSPDGANQIDVRSETEFSGGTGDGSDFLEAAGRAGEALAHVALMRGAAELLEGTTACDGRLEP